MTATVICFANQKGGVAKSTSCINVGSALAHKGARVLYVDVDPQADTTDGVGIDPDAAEYTVYEVLKGSVAAADAIMETPTGDILPGSIDMSTADLEFAQTGKEFMLKKVLAEVMDGYDYVLIDTPPSLGWCTINALTASDWMVIPCNASKWSNKALVVLNRTIGIIREYTNPALKVAGVLITNLAERTVNARTNIEASGIIGQTCGFPVFKTRIRRGVKLEDAQTDAVDLITAYPKSKPAMDYVAFAKELEGVVSDGN